MTGGGSIELAVFDMAGTTIEEGGAVYAALAAAVESLSGQPVPADLLARWMGAEKGEALAAMLAAVGHEADEAELARARQEFSDRLDQAYLDVAPTPIPGVEPALAGLRSRGVKVALTTGFSTRVARGILDAIGWEIGRDIDVLVTAEDVGAGRPSPKMIERAMALTGIDDPGRVLVCGDTLRDLEAGKAARARIVVGVLTGSQREEDLRSGPATHVIDSAAEIGALLDPPG